SATRTNQGYLNVFNASGRYFVRECSANPTAIRLAVRQIAETTNHERHDGDYTSKVKRCKSKPLRIIHFISPANKWTTPPIQDATSPVLFYYITGPVPRRCNFRRSVNYSPFS